MKKNLFPLILCPKKRESFIMKMNKHTSFKVVDLIYE